ncbi:MAG: UvrD/REP helicase [Fibrobacteres bacterium]|nr:UvrD/REP helicase [Fibrobacterota bacterium]
MLAGAGSGKTTVLTRRVAHLLERVPGGGILALTFTKDAAREMETRLRELLGPDSGTVSFPTIGTFHAFAFGLLRAGYQGIPNWTRLGFAKCPSLLEPADRAAWLREAKKELDLRAPLEMLEEWIANPFALAPADPAIPEWEVLRGKFRTHLLESGSVAFDDMVALAIRLLSGHSDVHADARSRYPHILVDEFQDTSRDQLDLVKLLAGEEPSLFLVGDDDQAIYGFRGADPANIGEALRHFPGLRILKLEINYRSSGPIVDYANGVFRDKPVHMRKRLEAGRSLGNAPVRTVVHGNGAEQGRWIVGEMERLRREEGLAWCDMAVLFRLNVLEPYYRSMLARLAGEDAAREVVLSTVHAAKGLEYPAVFFAGLEDGIVPYRRGGAEIPPEREAEERRIFYVGVTRAQRFLYLCSCRRRILRGKTVEAEASPFVRVPSALSGISGLYGKSGRAFKALRAWRRKKGPS